MTYVQKEVIYQFDGVVHCTHKEPKEARLIVICQWDAVCRGVKFRVGPVLLCQGTHRRFLIPL